MIDLVNERPGRIDAVDLIGIRMPLVKPFETSFGVQTDKEALLLRIDSEGVSGWGECVASPEPYYSYETNTTARHIIVDFLLPVLFASRTLAEALAAFTHVRGHLMAKAALENALLDLIARKRSVPLWALLDGEKKPIMSGISIGIAPSTDDLLATIERALAKKYHRVKLKIKRGREVEIVRSVRQRFPDIRLMADANADYTLDEAPTLKRLDEFGLMMIEQPLAHDDLYQHSLLQKQLTTAVCLDESIESVDDAKTAAALGSCRIINIKQGRVGGMLSSRAIADFARENGIKAWSGGMLETGIGRAVNIHLQTLPGFVLPGDTSETSRYFHEDIVDPPVVLDQDGWISIPDGPGIGAQVVAERLEKRLVSRETIRP